ncbi:ABC transporter ATP-binding protein [Tumebacillus sp. DT12]|uniref:ABC transporter ATP-binding protein n=1 Tax=Tumebacillus lacus TaxID=2995335 RepID=A0ABT3X4G0_9BACL|nr:ABC transporter ATP-binding protein [Tumebacillus lacus]MCX7571788.1 ABC transporter ATP-binding protein [Tumebacillus lacus]
MAKAVLKVEDVRKEFVLGSHRQTVLKGVNIEVLSGEFVALAGPSGSGKSTLLNLIGCLDVPDGGSIEIDGVEVGRLSAKEQARIRREKIGFVFQNFNLLPVLTAAENVEYPLTLLKVSAAERKERVRKALDVVGLTEHMHKRPTEMSGGQQQRVAIARALVTEPTVILADEPTSHLDQENSEIVVRLMQRLSREEGVTFLFTTHDPGVMAEASRVIRLRDGLIDAGAASEAAAASAVDGN